MREMLHGTAVAIDSHAVLILGPSGSGKSDLALRLIDRGAALISDDIVRVECALDGLILSVAPTIAGRIEVRGIGICTIDYISSAPLRLVIELAHEIDRMPPDDECATLGNFWIPMIRLEPFQSSSALKVEWALRRIIEAGRMPLAKHQMKAIEGTAF